MHFISIELSPNGGPLSLPPHALPELLVLVLVHLPLPLLLHAIGPHGSRIFQPRVLLSLRLSWATKPTCQNGFRNKPKREAGKNYGGTRVLRCWWTRNSCGGWVTFSVKINDGVRWLRGVKGSDDSRGRWWSSQQFLERRSHLKNRSEVAPLQLCEARFYQVANRSPRRRLFGYLVILALFLSSLYSNFY